MLTGKRFRLRGEELVSSPIGTPQDAATDREQVLEALKGLAGPGRHGSHRSGVAKIFPGSERSDGCT